MDLDTIEQYCDVWVCSQRESKKPLLISNSSNLWFTTYKFPGWCQWILNAVAFLQFRCGKARNSSSFPSDLHLLTFAQFPGIQQANTPSMMRTMTMIHIMIKMTMVNDDNYDDSFVACSTFKVIPRAHITLRAQGNMQAARLCEWRVSRALARVFTGDRRWDRPPRQLSSIAMFEFVRKEKVRNLCWFQIRPICGSQHTNFLVGAN